MAVPSDIEIARAASMQPIPQIADKLGIAEDALEPFGRTKAKVALDRVPGLADKPDGKLILVTAMTSPIARIPSSPPRQSRHSMRQEKAKLVWDWMWIGVATFNNPHRLWTRPVCPDGLHPGAGVDHTVRPGVHHGSP